MEHFIKKFEPQRNRTNMAHTKTLTYFCLTNFIGIYFLRYLLLPLYSSIKREKVTAFRFSNNLKDKQNFTAIEVLSDEQLPVTPKKNNLEDRKPQKPPKLARKAKRPGLSEDSRKTFI